METYIQFTTEESRPDGSMSFLDTLVTPDQNRTLSTTVCRKQPIQINICIRTATLNFLLSIVCLIVSQRARTFYFNLKLLQKGGNI